MCNLSCVLFFFSPFSVSVYSVRCTIYHNQRAQWLERTAVINVITRELLSAGVPGRMELGPSHYACSIDLGANSSPCARQETHELGTSLQYSATDGRRALSFGGGRPALQTWTIIMDFGEVAWEGGNNIISTHFQFNVGHNFSTNLKILTSI